MLLTDFINKEISKNILIGFIVILFIINIIHLSVFIIVRIYVETKNKILKTLEENYLNLIVNSFYNQGGKNLEIKIASNLQAEAFSNVLISLLENLSGDMTNFVLHLAQSSGIIEFYKKKTFSKNWLTRLDAFERLEYFPFSELLDFYLEALKREKNSYIKMQILINLSHLGNINKFQDMIDELNKLKNISNKFFEYFFYNIISTLHTDKEKLTFLKKAENMLSNEAIDISIKKAFIEACGKAHFYQSKDLILKIFYSINDPIFKAICIRSLGNMGLPEVCELIEKSYRSSEWILRLNSAKYAYLCENGLEILKTTIQDLNFHVRRASALAIKKLYEHNYKGVLDFIKELKDQYAKEILLSSLRRTEVNL